MSTERRSEHRSRANLGWPATLRSGILVVSGTVDNVSLRGLFVAMSDPLVIGVGSRVEITVSRDGHHATQSGSVVWVRENGAMAQDPVGCAILLDDEGVITDISRSVQRARQYRAPRIDNGHALRNLSRELSAAGFDDESLQRLASAIPVDFVFDAPYLFEPEQRASSVQPGTLLSSLVALFQEGARVPLGAVETAFSQPLARALFDCGFLEHEDGGVLATVTLVPWKHLVIAADRWDREKWDSVYQPSRATGRMAACFPLLRRGEHALDIGTGSGVHTLLLGRQGVHAVAVDPNPRALEFLKLNAALNDLPAGEPLLTDHTYLSRCTELRFVVFASPCFSYSTDVMAAGYADTQLGWQIVRDVYRLLPNALAPDGVAALRHEVGLDALNADAFLAHTQAPDSLEILYLFVDPTDPHEVKFRAEHSGTPWGDFMFGHALVRRRRGSATPRVSFATFSYDEITHYSARLHWTRVLEQAGWADALSR